MPAGPMETDLPVGSLVYEKVGPSPKGPSHQAASRQSGLVAPIDGAQILETLNAAEVGCAEIAPALGEALQRSIQTARFRPHRRRSEEHTSELQSLMSISYAVF